jgi:hypothetical protein
VLLFFLSSVLTCRDSCVITSESAGLLSVGGFSRRVKGLDYLLLEFVEVVCIIRCMCIRVISYLNDGRF